MKSAYHTSREWTKSAYAKLRGQPTDGAAEDDFGVKSAQEAYQVQASMFRLVSVLYPETLEDVANGTLLP